MDKQIAEMYADGKVNEAIHALIGKIDADPHETDNYLQLASYLLEQGSPEQAQKLLVQAKGLIKNPQDVDYDLAVAYYAQGEFNKSLALLNQIPNDDDTLYQKALVYLKTGQNEKALAHALSIKRVDDHVKELLGDIWLALGELKAASASYASIPEKQRTAKVTFLLGVSWHGRDRDRAEKFFARAKKMDPKYYKQAWDQYASIMKLVAGKDKKEQ